MPDIIHRIGIKAPEAAVYKALATIEGLAAWWTEETTGNPALGGRIVFAFSAHDGKRIGEMTMEVAGLEPQRRVEWRCVGGPPEWLETRLSYELSVEDDCTIVRFAHRGWREESEFMGHCSTKWATFLLSLRAFAETGKGSPAPNDLKIDNWN